MCRAARVWQQEALLAAEARAAEAAAQAEAASAKQRERQAQLAQERELYVVGVLGGACPCCAAKPHSGWCMP